MNFKTLIIAAISTWGTLISQAQSQDKVLFTLGDTAYYAEEFKRIYNKNLELIQDDTQRDIDHYLDLYVLYKRKVAKAYALKLDENTNYKSELKTNRDQLAERYLTDEKLTDELVVEAYQRSLKEINASHILFLLRSFSEPADTLKAYDKAIKIRNEILAGASFTEMAKKYSDDSSAKQNGGELGYFSAFKMVYPFESGAYNTAVGEVSMPIRSQFGYHLIKVNDIRDKRGELSIVHLMLQKPVDNDPIKTEEVTAKIKNIASELKNGADFDEMVRLYSDDKNAGRVGGKIDRFTPGLLLGEPALTEVAYKLQNVGDVSEPVETPVGWHLIKLEKKYPLPSFDEVRFSFQNKVQRDSRSRVVAENLMEKIKHRYSLKVEEKLKKEIEGLVTSDFYKNTWKIPANRAKYQKTLVTIDNSLEISALDFLQFLENSQQAYRGIEPLSKAVELAYEKYLQREMKNYYVANLEKEFPEFDYTVKEYSEGLLLFDLMESNIWNKAQADTLGYTAFYEKHKERYVQKPRLEMSVFELKSAKEAKKTLAKWRKKSGLIPEKTTDNAVVEGVYEMDSPEVSGRDLPLKTGVYKNPKNTHEVIFIKSVLPEKLFDLESVKGQVIQDYQEEFEEAWIQDLKDEKKLNVNQDVLEAVKKELTK